MYASFLALVSVLAKPRWSKVVTRHLNLLLVVTFGVYFYRNLFPLATYNRLPFDRAEGWIIWTKIAALIITGLAIPLVIPRQYVPIDPKVLALTRHTAFGITC